MLARTAAAVVSAVLIASPVTGQTRSDEEETSERVGSFGIAAGLGITEADASDMVDYLNTYLAASDERMSRFTTATEFFAAPEYRLSGMFSLTLEYSYLLKSYELSRWDYGTLTLTYGIHMPTLMLQRVVDGDGYAFKFGGGLGWYFGSMSEKLSVYGAERNARSSGPALALDIEGNSSLGDNLSVYLGADARFASLPELKDGDGRTVTFHDRSGAGRTLSLSFFSAGIKLGLLYTF